MIIMAYFLIKPWYAKKENVPSWSEATDEQVAELLQKHYAGEINLHDYWNVGDERTVSLSAIASSPSIGFYGCSAQNVVFVIMNKGGKTLTNNQECAFVVGQKSSLNEKGVLNENTYKGNAGGWDNSNCRTWCNSYYKNAIPSSLIGIFKEYKNNTGNGYETGNAIVTSNDYFSLPAEIEVFGTRTYSVAGEGNQFDYYKTASNRIKSCSGSAYIWWLRSPVNNGKYAFCQVLNDGTVYSRNGVDPSGIAPFGCI